MTIMNSCTSHLSIWNWKDFLPLISPAIVIILFGIERIVSYRIRKKEIERTWYYKVLIDPSLPQISKFFLNVEDSYRKSSEILLRLLDMPHNSFINEKSKEIGIFQKMKRDFDIEIVTPITHRYPLVGNELTSKLMDLEDKYTTFIDGDRYSEEDIEVFNKAVSTLKAIWLNILYKPIKE